MAEAVPASPFWRAASGPGQTQEGYVASREREFDFRFTPATQMTCRLREIFSAESVATDLSATRRRRRRRRLLLPCPAAASSSFCFPLSGLALRSAPPSGLFRRRLRPRPLPDFAFPFSDSRWIVSRGNLSVRWRGKGRERGRGRRTPAEQERVRRLSRLGRRRGAWGGRAVHQRRGAGVRSLMRWRARCSSGG